jgi:hypothetical protein
MITKSMKFTPAMWKDEMHKLFLAIQNKGNPQLLVTITLN